MRRLSALLFLLLAGSAFAGEYTAKEVPIEPPRQKRWEVMVETAQMMNIDNNPNRYYFSTQMVSLAWQPFPVLHLGPVNIRTQILSTFYAAAILRGPETFYFGWGPQIRFIIPLGETRWSLYGGAGCGMGGADAHQSNRDDRGLGQEFTFILLANGGIRYAITRDLSVWGGFMWHHLSNANMSTKVKRNTGPDEIGPVVGMGYAF
ncbi:MAG: acyloxyacyl hydrolase [Chthoniobacterales bacterium]